jgi:hypothetical protein
VSSVQSNDVGYAVLGAAVAAERRSRAVVALGVRAVGVATWPAARAWESGLAGPLRSRAAVASAALARDGREVAARSGAQARTIGGELIQRLADQLLRSGLADEVVDRLLTTGAIDRVVTVVINHPATEALLVSAFDDPGVDRLVARVMDSRLVDELTARLLESEELQEVLNYVMGSPELRAALAQQTAGLAGDMADGVRSRTVRADDRAERLARSLFRRPQRPEIK